MAALRLPSRVRVVQRWTFLELAEAPDGPEPGGRPLRRSLSDSALLHERVGLVPVELATSAFPGQEAACGEEPELASTLASTSVGDEAEAGDTCSICSWTTDLDRELPSAHLGFCSARLTCDHGFGSTQALQDHALHTLRRDHGDGNSNGRNPEEDAPWKPRRQRVRKFPKAGRRIPQEEPEADAHSLPTTLILRGVPGEWTLQDVSSLLDAEGFRGTYDFIHVPVKFHDLRNVGYAIVNLLGHEAADAVRRRLHGLALGAELLAADWNATCQGLTAQVAKYRSSAVMHESVPEQNRPGLFYGGVRVPFPAPAGPIRAPRVRINKRAA